MLDRNDPRIIYLRVAHWGGLVYRALHWYGFLQRGSGGDEVQVMRVITKAEADRINEEDFGKYDGPKEDLEAWNSLLEAGQESGRFWDEDSMLKAAVETCRREFPDAILLIQGSGCVLDPRPVLTGPAGVAERLNEIVQQCEANNWWEGDEETMEALCREWDAVWEEL